MPSDVFKRAKKKSLRGTHKAAKDLAGLLKHLHGHSTVAVGAACIAAIAVFAFGRRTAK